MPPRSGPSKRRPSVSARRMCLSRTARLWNAFAYRIRPVLSPASGRCWGKVQHPREFGGGNGVEWRARKRTTMPSLFPGMDPYLEGSEWSSVHVALSAEMARQLAPKVRPKYIVRTARRFVTDMPDDIAVTAVDLYPD